MPRKLTNDEFVIKLKDIQPNIVPLESYVNTHTIIKCQCLKHKKICYSTPKRLLNGHCCCKECVSEEKRNRLLRTHDDFLQELQDRNIDVVPLERYKGNSVKMLFRCSCGDLWETTPERVLLGNHCKKCGYRNLRGANNHFYNSRLSDEDRRDANHRFRNPLYKQFVMDCFARDDYTCQITGKKSNGDIVVHHINGYNWDVENRTNIENGITLNKDIHNEFHKIYGKGNNTKSQFVEFVNLLCSQGQIMKERRDLILERLKD